MKIISLTTRNLKEIYRDPVTLLLGIALPVLFLFLFTSLFKNSQLSMFSPQALAPGVVVFSYAFTIMFSAVLLAKDKQSAFLLRLFATPLKPWHFITSYLLPFIPFTIAQTLVCFSVAGLLGASFTNLFPVAVILLLTAISCITIGIILGSLFTVNQVSGIGSIFITLISLFSGAWMDLKSVGGIFENLGYSMPFTHAIDASRKLLQGENLNAVSTNCYVVLAYAGLLLALSVIAFNFAMKRK